MAPDNLRHMHWRDRWEYEAKREAEKYQKQSEETLLEQIRGGSLGSYYRIWHEISRKGILENSALVLLDFLQQHPGDNFMHHRYHCAGALLKIIIRTDIVPDAEIRKEIQWDHEGEERRQRKLSELREFILAKLDGSN